MAMAILNGLQGRFDLFISAFDALRDEKTFTFELVKRSPFQEGKRNQLRIESSLNRSEEIALVSSQH